MCGMIIVDDNNNYYYEDAPDSATSTVHAREAHQVS